jgi:tRNA A58 N-methylase Trm61
MTTSLLRPVGLAAMALLSMAGAAAGQAPLNNFEKETLALQPPDKVMDAVGVKPGMVIGELGAGRGRFTVHLAGLR